MRDASDPRRPRDLRVIPGTGDGGDLVRVFVIARYPSLRAGLRALIEQTLGLIVAADAADDELDTAIVPDALVVDIDPDQPGLLARLISAHPEAALVLLFDSAAAISTLTVQPERAAALLLKDAGPAELGAAIQAARQGLVVLDPAIAREFAAVPPAAPSRSEVDEPVEPLTARELQVLELLAHGLPNKTIAMELGISEHTAKFHVGAIMSKLGAASRTEAVALAARRGLLVL